MYLLVCLLIWGICCRLISVEGSRTAGRAGEGDIDRTGQDSKGAGQSRKKGAGRGMTGQGERDRIG